MTPSWKTCGRRAGRVCRGRGSGRRQREPAGTASEPRQADTDRPSPQALKQRELRAGSGQAPAAGKIPKGAKVAKIGQREEGQGRQEGQGQAHATSSSSRRDGEDTIWTVLVEFGDQQATHVHGSLGPINHGGTPGPMHNQITQPDRTVDNTTIWAPDFSKSRTTRTCSSPERRASARCATSTSRTPRTPYAVNGKVEDWVKLPVQRGGLWLELLRRHRLRRDIQRLLADGLNGGTRSSGRRQDAGRQINTYLSAVRQVGSLRLRRGRQLQRARRVHRPLPDRSTPARARRPAAARRARTRSGATARTPTLARSASSGPAVQPARRRRRSAAPNYWVFDYTIEPENGGVGVFAHEFGHDLGIPDEYDTSATPAAPRTRPASGRLVEGSYGSDGSRRTGSATEPFSMSAWDKLRFGWLDYQHRRRRATARRSSRWARRRRKSKAGKQAADRQPARQAGARRRLGDPVRRGEVLLLGHGQRHGQHDDEVGDAAVRARALTAKVRYNIEEGWDYAYVLVSTTAARRGRRHDEPLDATTNPNGQNFGNGHHRRLRPAGST